MHSTASSAPQQIRRPGPLFNWLAVITLIYLILVAVGAVSHGFKGFSGGAEGAAQIFAFANNPSSRCCSASWPPPWCNPPAPSPR